MEMWHGKSGALALHPGVCLAGTREVAANYALYGAYGPDRLVHGVEGDWAGLRVVELDGGYDRDANVAPGDTGEYPDADVIVYDDETPSGQYHRTWRLMTPAAVATARHTASLDAEEV